LYICAMNNAKYYETPENVILIYPVDRFLSRIFGKESMIIRCKTCKKIPTEVANGYCLNCYPKI